MKLFQQLMLAPVAVGLIAPSATAAELNFDGVNQYSTSEQVTSVSQFSDVRPTDWAYQALSNLVERYGCVAGYPDGTFRGGSALTRYEAAALLNACLDRVSEVTDELRALLNEFATELAVLRGRVDGLEAQVGVLEAQQFSTTTKLSGEVNFVLGGVPDYRSRGTAADGTAFNYDLKLNLDTSFTGRDLLRTRLRSGNFSDLPFGSNSSLYKLDKAVTTDSGVEIDRLYYQFPVGESVVLTVGPKVRNTEMTWVPSAYSSEILDFFTTAGAPGVYNKAVGAGVGIQYGTNGFVASLNYVSENGDSTETGVFNSDGALNVLAQLGYRQENWGVAVGYRYGTEGSRVRTYNGFLGASGALAPGQTSNSVAVNAYWQPVESGTIVPSVSAGYGYNAVNGRTGVTDATNSQSWFVGLQWDDVFSAGNSAGVAVGQPANSNNVSDATMLEVFYRYQVTDNISITPSVFYVSNDAAQRGNVSEWGGVIQTKFIF